MNTSAFILKRLISDLHELSKSDQFKEIRSNGTNSDQDKITILFGAFEATHKNISLLHLLKVHSDHVERFINSDFPEDERADILPLVTRVRSGLQAANLSFPINHYLRTHLPRSDIATYATIHRQMCSRISINKDFELKQANEALEVIKAFVDKLKLTRPQKALFKFDLDRLMLLISEAADGVDQDFWDRYLRVTNTLEMVVQHQDAEVRDAVKPDITLLFRCRQIAKTISSIYSGGSAALSNLNGDATNLTDLIEHANTAGNLLN
jgi:hypothetical protein